MSCPRTSLQDPSQVLKNGFHSSKGRTESPRALQMDSQMALLTKEKINCVCVGVFVSVHVCACMCMYVCMCECCVCEQLAQSVSVSGAQQSICTVRIATVDYNLGSFDLGRFW